MANKDDGKWYIVESKPIYVYMCKQTGELFEAGRCGRFVCPGIVKETNYFRFGNHWSKKIVGARPSKRQYKKLGELWRLHKKTLKVIGGF